MFLIWFNFLFQRRLRSELFIQRWNIRAFDC